MRRDPWIECIIRKSDKRGKEKVTDSIIESFLENIIQDREIDVRIAYEIFSARGFLLKFKNNNYKLSNNSDNDDRAPFRELRRNVRYRENHQWKYYKLGHRWTQIFKLPSRNETKHLPWFNFWQEERGDKICVAKLDPFIARLVKSFSSIGLATWISCDGHGKYGTYVIFKGSYSAMWFDVIFNEFIKKKIRLKCHWTNEHFENSERPDYYILQIWHPEKDYVVLYTEIQNVAKLLYEHRIELIEIKKDMCSKIWIDDNYIFNLFQKNSDFTDLVKSLAKE